MQPTFPCRSNKANKALRNTFFFMDQSMLATYSVAFGDKTSLEEDGFSATPCAGVGIVEVLLDGSPPADMLIVFFVSVLYTYA